MNIKSELIKTFKNLMGVYFGKVYSSSELNISDKSVGGKVELIQADGTLAPAPDGDYVMDNGFSFTVKDGLISSIVGEQPVQAEETPVEAAAPTSGDTVTPTEDPAEEADPADPAKDIKELEDRVTVLEQQMAECMAMCQDMSKQKMESEKSIEAFTKEVKQLNDNIQILAKVPVEFSKTNKSVVVEETKEDQLFSIAKMIGGLK